jgi:hypothetical protein
MRKQSEGAERQEYYRRHHPQWNLTFQSEEECRQIREACRHTRQTPRQVLLAWAQAVLEEAASEFPRR